MLWGQEVSLRMYSAEVSCNCGSSDVSECRVDWLIEVLMSLWCQSTSMLSLLYLMVMVAPLECTMLVGVVTSHIGTNTPKFPPSLGTTALWPYSNGAVQIRVGLELVEYGPGGAEQKKRKSPPAGTGTRLISKCWSRWDRSVARWSRKVQREDHSKNIDFPEQILARASCALVMKFLAAKPQMQNRAARSLREFKG